MKGNYNMETKLKPLYDSRASFYGKAKVIDHPNYKELMSYVTYVAAVKGKKAEVYGIYSRTTLRHIKEFLKQNGFKADTAKQIIVDYGASREER